MSVRQILKPEEVWEYWMEHPDEIIGQTFEIASCSDFGISVYMVANNASELRISVEADDTEIYDEAVINNVDCLKTCEKIYNDYLFCSMQAILETLGVGNVVTEQQRALEEIQKDEIDEREESISEYIREFIAEMIGFNVHFDIDDDVIEDIKEHFLEYMSRKHSIPIYRPMYLEDADTGEDYYAEYPYEDMVFDDEDNPLYKKDA